MGCRHALDAKITSATEGACLSSDYFCASLPLMCLDMTM